MTKENRSLVEFNDLGTGLKNRFNRISINDLLRGCSELIIEHAEQDYRLRITSKGKLILTK